MVSKQHGLGPELHGLTSGHISLGLVLNHSASKSAKPPIKNDWDVMFQSMFDEYFKPPSAVSTPISVATLFPSDTARASSSTTIDQDAPSSIKEEQKNYKEEMEESIWIEAMQEEIHEFERLELWKLVPRPDRAMIISLKWIFKVKLNKYGEVLKNKVLLDAKVFQMDVNTTFLSGNLKEEVYATEIQDVVHRERIAVSGNTVQHHAILQDKHIDVRYHFNKKQVENEVVEIYFVETDYQLADIFTKALARERFKFLINRLGMQSITPKELKCLADSDEE
nr:Gag-Pol polyprotein [Tanacetum cinerariifolium]